MLLNPPKKNIAKKTILLIDDHPSNRYIINKQLKDLDYLCIQKENGADAIKAYQENHNNINLILLDINLVGMNGFQVATIIREFEKNHKITKKPIISLSSETGVDFITKYQKNGINGALSKPILKNQLKTLLSLWIPDEESTNKSLPTPDTYESNTYEAFIRCNQEDFSALSMAINSGHYQQAQRHIHRIHGAAHTIGATSIALAAENIKNGILLTPTAINPLLETLRIELDKYSTSQSIID